VMTGTSHGCWSRGLVGSQSHACHSSYESGVISRVTSSPVVGGPRSAQTRCASVSLTAFLYAYLSANSTSFIDVELFLGDRL